jgi:hypothetical protein
MVSSSRFAPWISEFFTLDHNGCPSKTGLRMPTGRNSDPGRSGDHSSLIIRCCRSNLAFWRVSKFAIAALVDIRKSKIGVVLSFGRHIRAAFTESKSRRSSGGQCFWGLPRCGDCDDWRCVLDGMDAGAEATDLVESIEESSRSCDPSSEKTVFGLRRVLAACCRFIIDRSKCCTEPSSDLVGEVCVGRFIDKSRASCPPRVLVGDGATAGDTSRFGAVDRLSSGIGVFMIRLLHGKSHLCLWMVAGSFCSC